MKLMFDCDPTGVEVAKDALWYFAERLIDVRLLWSPGMYGAAYLGKQPESLGQDVVKALVRYVKAAIRAAWISGTSPTFPSPLAVPRASRLAPPRSFAADGQWLCPPVSDRQAAPCDTQSDLPTDPGADETVSQSCASADRAW